MDASVGLAAAYIAVQEVLRPRLTSFYGAQNCGGTPCWRASLVLLPQFVLLPGCIAALALQHGSLRAWCNDSASNGLGLLARFAVLIFYSFLIVDLFYQYLLSPPVVLRQLMIDHHLVCLAGHIYATLLCPKRARPCYLFAICALEVGSGFANVFWLTQTTAAAQLGGLAYLIGMTISNVAASILLLQWNAQAREAGLHPVRRVPCILIVAVLVLMRQKEVHALVLWPFAAKEDWRVK